MEPQGIQCEAMGTPHGIIETMTDCETPEGPYAGNTECRDLI